LLSRGQFPQGNLHARALRSILPHQLGQEGVTGCTQKAKAQGANFSTRCPPGRFCGTLSLGKREQCF